MSSKPIIIGKIGAPYGVRGWVKIISFTEPAENIFNYLPWQLQKGNKKQTLQIAAKRIHDMALIAHPIDCNDRDTAQTYTNAEIIIQREQLPPLPQGEYYWTDLEGMNVVTLQGQSLGTVIEIFSTGANDVLVVEGEKRHLIPFLKGQVVLHVDITQKTIQVDWDPEF